MKRRVSRSALIAASAAALLVGCDDRPAQWDAFVYPGDDLLTHEEIRGFVSFELCQEAAQHRLQSLRPDGGGDYECGYRCGPLAPGSTTRLCKETRK
jgi:hypothetical protein